MDRRLENPRISQPAPATSVMASPISATVIALSQRAVPRPPLVERPLSLSSVLTSVARQPQRRRKANQHAADDERDEREHQHPAVERHRLEPRQRRGADDEQQPDADVGDEETDQRAGRRQQRRLCQQLAHDAAASGAERDAHGHLARPRRAAREQQVRHVDAREHEEQRRRREDDDEDRSEIADDRFDERADDVDPGDGAGRKVARDRRHHTRHLGSRALDGRAGLQAHERLEAVVHALRVELVLEPEIGVVRRVEIPRRHARDGRRDLGEADRLADDRPDRCCRGSSRCGAR